MDYSNIILAAEQLIVGELILDSTGVVMAVLVILVAMSLASWFIIAMKLIYLAKARGQTDQFQDIFWKSKRLDNTYKEAENLKSSPTAQMFRAGYVELTKLKKGENKLVLRLTQINADSKFSIVFSKGATCSAHYTDLIIKVI